METKEIIQALKCCHNSDECEDCEYNELGEFCEELLKRDAAKRLEELEAELGKRTINDRPYEWISVEDGKEMPDAFSYTGICHNQFPRLVVAIDENSHVTHWMMLDPPKPKEPTFKDVFLKAFPKVVVLPESGVPVVCAKQVFPQLGDDESPCDMCCAVCWNQPYFETEGEGEQE